MNGSVFKNKGPYFTRLVGSGFDELSFYIITTWRGWQRRQKYVSDPTELAALRKLAESEQAAQVFNQLISPPLPTIEIQNKKMPLLLRDLARSYRYTELTFPSSVLTAFPSNNLVHAHHLYRPDHKNGPTLLYLHGWMDFKPEISLRPPLRWVAPLGYNLVMLELPHHMNRISPGTYSGELTLTGNLPAMTTLVSQAIGDIRALLAWLRARGIARVALAGKSLGGAVAAMTLTVESGLDCAVLFVPAVEPSASLWHSTYTRAIRTELSRQGIDEAATQFLLEAFRPARYQPLISREKILVVGATGDKVAFPHDVEAFAQAWQAELALVEWGHLSSGWTPAAAKAIRPFLSRWLG